MTDGRSLSFDAGSGEAQAVQRLTELANDSGNSTLKLNLAEQGISLTDNSDVGPGKRFANFTEKLLFVLQMKMSLVLAMRMSMVSGKWSPTMTDDVQSARTALRGPPEGAQEGPGRGGDTEITVQTRDGDNRNDGDAGDEGDRSDRAQGRGRNGDEPPRSRDNRGRRGDRSDARAETPRNRERAEREEA